MKKDSIFDKIDSYFESQPNKNVFILSMILCVVLFAYLIEEYTYIDSEEYLEEQQANFMKAENDLKRLNEFIEGERINSRVEVLKRQLKRYEDEKNQVTEKNDYFANKLQEASNLLYNQKNWSEFMSKINEVAAKYNIKLGDISSNVNDPTSQKVEEIFNVSFNMSGRFQNILYFINSLENSVDIVDVSVIKMYSINDEADTKEQNDNTVNKNNPTKDVGLDVKILVWGIKY